jgi:hypothetical protein
LVIQQGSEKDGSSMKVSQLVNLKNSGDYTLTFRKRHRSQDGQGNTYYDPRQRLFVTILDKSGTVILPENDCTPSFNPTNPKWERMNYKFNISTPGNFTLRFTVKLPPTSTPGTGLFLTDIDITKDSNIVRAPPAAQSVMSCDGFVDGYTKNLISSTTEQGIAENDKNSYTSVFSDIVTNTIHNPVSDYFSFNLRTK